MWLLQSVFRDAKRAEKKRIGVVSSRYLGQGAHLVHVTERPFRSELVGTHSLPDMAEPVLTHPSRRPS